MADYIDRESLVTDMQKRFCEDCDRRKGKKNGRVRFVYDIGDAPCRACWVDDAIGEIEDYPSADVQPVVRCKDCKHRDAEDGLCKGRGWPMQLVPDDGFCDKGERSEE